MDDRIFCTQCGTENPFSSNFCFRCGQGLIHSSEEIKSIKPGGDPTSIDSPQTKATGLTAQRRFFQKLTALNDLIHKETESLVGTGRKEEIQKLVNSLCDSKDKAEFLLLEYNKQYQTDLVEVLKQITSSYQGIKDYLSPFIRFGIIQPNFPHEYTQGNAPPSGFSDIKTALTRLRNTTGFVIISVGDYYVQLDRSDNNLKFEAVSKAFLPSLGDKDQEFEDLSFSVDSNGNYFKDLSIENISMDSLVADIRTIFQDIYKIPLVGYSIESEGLKKSDPPIGTIMKESPKRYNRGCLIFVGIAVIFALYSVFTDSNDTNYDEVVKNSAIDASVHQVESYLKNEYLKDPDSYEGIEWSKVMVVENVPTYKYRVRHKYRAKNSFGGYVIENKVFYLNSRGEVVSVEDFGAE